MPRLKALYSSSRREFSQGGEGSTSGSDLGMVARPGGAPDDTRYFLSHFPPGKTTPMTIGPLATRSFRGGAPFVRAIRLSATAAAGSRLMMRPTTGSGSGAATVIPASRALRSFPAFPSLTRTTACWPTARRYAGVLWRAAPGKRRRPWSKILIGSPTLLRSAGGFAGWTVRNPRSLFCAQPSER